MISGIDLQATVDFVLKDDKENPTIWKLGAISSYLLAKISANAKDNEIDTAYKMLQVCLRGWENFSEKFEQVEDHIYGIKVKIVPLPLLEKIRMSDIMELSSKAWEINNLTQDERKN